MRVFSKKAFEFTRREMKDGVMVVAEQATTLPLSFCDLPDWAQNDPMFDWARADGDIEIIQNKSDEKKAEVDASKGLAEKKADAAAKKAELDAAKKVEAEAEEAVKQLVEAGAEAAIK